MRPFDDHSLFLLLVTLAQQPKFEAVLSEIDMVINELHYAISNLSSWMKLEYVDKNLVGQTWIYS